MPIGDQSSYCTNGTETSDDMKGFESEGDAERCASDPQTAPQHSSGITPPSVSDMDLSVKVNPLRIIPHSPANYQDCGDSSYELLACITEGFGNGDIVVPRPVGAARVPKDLGVSAHAPADAIKWCYEKCAPAVSRESRSLLLFPCSMLDFDPRLRSELTDLES